jgi:hypothetical protein
MGARENGWLLDIGQATRVQIPCEVRQGRKGGESEGGTAVVEEK